MYLLKTIFLTNKTRQHNAGGFYFLRQVNLKRSVHLMETKEMLLACDVHSKTTRRLKHVCKRNAELKAPSWEEKRIHQRGK